MFLFSRKNIKYSICYILFLSLPLILMPEPFWLAAQQLDEGEKLFQEGVIAIKQGAYDVAITRLEQAKSLLDDKDKKAECYFYLWLSYFNFDKKNISKEYLIEALKLNPKMKPNRELCSKEFLFQWEELKRKPVVVISPPDDNNGKSKSWLWILLGGAAAAAAIVILTRGKAEGTKILTTSITVNSTPYGAKIYLNGMDTGHRTNYTLTNISPGNHTIKLSLSGFDDWSTLVNVTEGQQASVNHNMSSQFYSMVQIPAGEFLMGNDTGEANERPVHKVYLDAFYIDKYQVTNEQYKGFIDATGQSAPQNWNNNNYPQGKKKHPVVFVSWYDAKAYAEWLGKRLATEAEWEKAARGGLNQMDYPWGNNTGSNLANYSDYVNDTTIVGRYPPNGYGLYDMAGNVWEWVNDWYGPNYYTDSPYNNPDGPSYGSLKCDRGGSYHSNSNQIRCAFRGKLNPNEKILKMGFRCVKD